MMSDPEKTSGENLFEEITALKKKIRELELAKEKKLWEEKVKNRQTTGENEIRFQYLVKNSSDLIVIIDAHGREKFVSNSVERITGYTPQEVIGHSEFEFIHPDDVEPMKDTLKELLENVTGNFIQTLELNPDQIQLELSDQAISAYCDRQQTSSTVKEILTNALEATDASNLRITIRTRPDDEGQYVYLQITDNGPGMEGDVLNKALDPFFSARQAGRGRGLGLSRAYRYIQSNNGTLWLESHPGAGTTVFIKLPGKSTPPRMDAKG
jgi:PAS domain S-box-containing protein